MASGIREFLDSPKGKAIAFSLVGVGLLAVGISLWANMSPASEIQDANNPLYINAQTGQQKRLSISVGQSVPDGWYKAEWCYWTKDGKPTEKATPVLLNKYKGSNTPTFCPECGRLVVDHNPPAVAGDRPPPTQAEYKPRR
jgi:hypothetical protein